MLHIMVALEKDRAATCRESKSDDIHRNMMEAVDIENQKPQFQRLR